MPTTTTAPPAQPSAAIARQAILDASRKVFGYELFDRSVLADAHTASSDAKMLFNVLSSADSDAAATSKVYFVNCTPATLASGHLDLVAPERLVLEIAPEPIADADAISTRLPILQNLHERGFKLAFDYSILTRPYESWLPLASFIKFDLTVLKADSITSFVKLAQAKSRAQLIAEKVETAEEYALLSGLGVGLFQGYWFAKPVLLEGQTVRPAQANILHLISLVRNQASTSEIEEVLKRDPTLSFHLLRFINSAGFGMRTEVTSFKHAVMLLGLTRLFKWAALLMTTSQSNDTASAVGGMAVVRGRLMELLALEVLPAEECDNAFVVGVFSLLEAMLGVPMKTALEGVALPASVTQALLNRTGPLAGFLELTLACESGDDAVFAHNATILCLTSQQINWAHLQALAWAEALTQ